MIRPFLILTILLFWEHILGQVVSSDTIILKEVFSGAETCVNFYFTDRTDTLFIKQFEEHIRQNRIRLYDNPDIQIKLSKADQDEIPGLQKYRTHVWTNPNITSNGRIIQLDSLHNVDYYVDSECFKYLQQSDRPIIVQSFSKPIFFNGGNSFVIYVIEIGMHQKWKKIFYGNTRLTLYNMTNSKWTRTGDIFRTFYCNG